jgi:Tol biopolymer transport system component/DNA-binding winged helix-turn-helix (wHTH) protein
VALIQPSLNRITIEGRASQVEPKVMQVLTLMASQPGMVVSRETFFETVWAGTTGDDSLLNRAVSELRKIFGDDAQTPRYIETIRKTGYRLVAPIAPATVISAVPSEPVRVASKDSGDSPLAGTARIERRPLRWISLAVSAFVLVALIVAILTLGPLASSPRGSSAVPQAYDVRPLTSLVGREIDPALSPDASRVAFVWDGGVSGASDVYVKTIGSESLLNLTNSDAAERHPVWSADGRFVLFARRVEDGMAIMRVSALGGAATRVQSEPAFSDIRGVGVSPDGAWIAYAGRENPASPYRIVLASLESGVRRVLSEAEPGSLGDIEPIFARDSRSIVFVRAINEVNKDIHVMDAGGGEPTRITFDHRKINGLAWAPDGQRLLFTSTRSGMYGLWTVSPGGGEPQLATLQDERVQRPTTAAGSGYIVFEEWIHRAQVRRIHAVSGMEIASGGLVGSTRWDSAPSFAPDGARVAFTSNRNGPPGIWVSDRDGRNAVQLVDLRGAFIESPAWSPDGRLIAFDGSPEGRTAIFTISPEGGTPRQVTAGPHDSRNPSWSRDGAWIYFESSNDTASRIFAQPVAGGAPVEITTGTRPRESVDGRWLVYTKANAPGLWRRPRQVWETSVAGPEEQLLEELEIQDGDNWVLAAGGVYFVRRAEGRTPALSFFEYEKRATRDIASLSPSFEGWGLDLSPDENELVFAEPITPQSDLRLAIPRSPAAPPD